MAPEQSDEVLYEVIGRVGVATLHRPERMNAWTPEMERQLRQRMHAAERDAGVHAVVITGSGVGFCAGGDTSGRHRIEAGSFDEGLGPDPLPAGALDAPAALSGRFSYLLGMDKPVIAAVNGAATGVGFVLLCFADIRFAGRGVKLATSFSRFGLPAEHGVSWMLPRLVGAGRAADWLLSARMFTADEGREAGLIQTLTEPDQVLARAIAYAEELAATCAPGALRVIKRQLYADLEGRLAASADGAYALMMSMVTSEDLGIGVQAFLDRSMPAFSPPRTEA